jgi:glycosyltransferase involved in cell wall biosynthesis
MDSDLQHPVNCIPEMLEIYLNGNCDVVIGIREIGQEESFLRRRSSKLFYKILSLVSDVKIEKNAGDFRLMSRMVVDTLINLPESQKVFRFLVTSFGFKIQRITFRSPERKYGHSKYKAKNLFKLAVSSLIGFSTAPLTSIFIGGLAIFVLSFFYLIFLFVNYINGSITPGWTSIAALVVSLSSVQIISIGIVGRYISQILLESRARPRFIIRESRSID